MTYAFIEKKKSTKQKKNSPRNILYNCLSLYTVKICLLYGNVGKRRHKAEWKEGKCVNQAGWMFDTRGGRQIFPDLSLETLTGNNVACK
jgi:hypothetical protein